MKKIFWLFVAIIPHIGIAQVTDTFSDGDFSVNPVWQGTATQFMINGTSQLQLNDNVAATSYLSTLFVTDNLDNYEWRFYIKMTFSPSGSNFGRVYLTSDNEDLAAPLNGYFLQFGEAGSNDAVELFRQSGLVNTSVCRATDAQIANSFELWVKIIRDEASNWQLQLATTEGGDFSLAASGNDGTHTSSAFMGIRCTYTASNATKFFFDDFFAGDPLQDNSPPEWVQVEATSQNTLEVEFSEKVTALSATSTTNYILNSLQQPSAASLLEDEQTVQLTFAESFDNASTNLLEIQGVFDLAGNEMSVDEKSFFFFEQETLEAKDIIFSEIMADPSPPQMLPEAEFIEIYNRSDKVINLINVKLIDSGNELVLPEYFLFPETYVLLTRNVDAPLFNIENAIGVNSFPTLTNTGELLLLKDLNNETLDSLSYDDDWYSDDEKKSGGFSLERINQHNFCINDAENWIATLSTSGGSPGVQNTILDNTPDTEAPQVIAVTVEGNNTISVYFSEKLHEELPDASQFHTQPSTSIGNLFFSTNERNVIEIQFQESLQPSIIYNLMVSEIEDCIGNASASTLDAGSFVLAEAASFQDIIITELLPDPNPAVGLPDVEFVELYNRSNKIINLRKFILTDGASVGIIPDYILLPNQYVLLLPDIAIAQYGEAITNKVGVKNFPTINNTNETILLLDSIGLKIDTISYQPNWYQDEDKQSGGWSLERIDLNNFCFEFENWSATKAISGGTPGLQNSVYSNKLDSIAPNLLSVFAENEFKLRLFFNERLREDFTDQTSIKTQPNLGIENINFGDERLKEIELNLSSALEIGNIYSLSILGGHDCSGNEVEEDTVNYFGLSGTASWQDIVINEIMIDPSPTQGLPEIEYIELYNNTNNFFELENWTLKDNSISIKLDKKMFLPESFLIICATQNVQYFSDTIQVLGLSGFPGLSNTGESIAIRNQNNTLIDSIYYNSTWYNDQEKMEGGWSLERIGISNPCSQEKNWRASIQNVGGTPGFPNSVNGKNLDTDPPYLATITLESDKLINLKFNETLSENFLNEATITIIPNHAIESVVFSSADLQQVSVLLTESLIGGEVYKIIINGGSDCSGNELSDAIVSSGFGLSGETETGDVIINEIMADPIPGQGLPEVEYIEIFNRSKKLFNLQQWTLSSNGYLHILPSKYIMPESWLVICSPTNSAKFANADTSLILALPGFVSLSNSGQALSISDNKSLLLDSINYNTSWYHNDEKNDGGWSLERIDPDNFCLESENWKASNAITGGTPGMQNSVIDTIEDTQVPLLLSVQLENDSLLKVSFNEKLSRDFSNEIMLVLDPYTEIDKTFFMNEGLKEIGVLFKEPLVAGIVYRATISNVRDCIGNQNFDEIISLPFGASTFANWKDVILNEVMADPSPTRLLPEAEYIELFNRSSKLINLHNWTIRDSGASITLEHAVVLPDSFLILCSEQHVQLFKQFGETLALNNFPSLSNSGESITLINAEGTLIDSIHYKDTWYLDPDKKDGGWSLELIDKENTCAEETNWAASENDAGGTPGKQNSIAGAKPDLTGPKLIDAYLINPEQLVLKFDEKLDLNVPQSSTIIINPELNISQIQFADNSLRTLSVQFANPVSENTLYQLELTQLYDCAGNAIQLDHNQISFVLPQQAQPGDLIINEILFNPLSGGVDFVEVYNQSNKYINLKKWNLTNIVDDEIINEREITKDNLVLHPHSYLVFATDQELVLNYYPQAAINSFFETSLPSMPDDYGSLAITDSTYQLVDYFFYTEEMHNRLLKDVEGVSLERVSGANNTNDPNIWRSGLVVTNFATPGYKNANMRELLAVGDEVKVDPEIFEPVYGQPNYTSINYKFDQGGYAANATIYDAQGRLVKNLANNQVLGNEGFFTWDGDQEDGTKARVGYYTLWLEVFDNTGFVKTFRKRVVVATRF